MTSILETAKQLVALKGAHADQSWHVQHGQFAKLCAENAGVLADELLDAESTMQTAHSWLDRWGAHAGNCRGDERCTCGLVAVRSEIDAFLSRISKEQDNG
jgi:hypothetical protein